MVIWTWADKEAGFTQLHAQLAAQTDTELIREYMENMLSCFDRCFGHNARILQREIAAELLQRGIAKIPHIFEAIIVTRGW